MIALGRLGLLYGSRVAQHAEVMVMTIVSVCEAKRVETGLLFAVQGLRKL